MIVYGFHVRALKKNLKVFLLIEAGQTFMDRSSLTKEKELKRLACSINYHVKESNASRGRHKDKANNNDS